VGNYGVRPITGPNCWTKQIAKGEAANAANAAEVSFTVVPNTVMGGTTTTPYTGKGLEELKKICRETPGCVGFNYSRTRKSGTFVMGKETGTFPQGAMDGRNVAKSVPIVKTVPLPTGEQVYMIDDDGYAKMASSSGVAKYYRGSTAAFDPSRWNTYTNNPDNYIAMAPPQEFEYYRKMT